MHVEPMVTQLFDLGAVRFGSFTLKSGMTSPIYIDLRLTISNPKLLVAIAEILYHPVRSIAFDLVCGVPYTALPFATAISIQHTIPMVMRRKEKKEYGTGKMIEGLFARGQTCLIIEDVVTSGKSILETVEPLGQEGLVVRDAVVLVDRGQGGAALLEEKGIRLHSVLTLPSMVEILLKEKRIDAITAKNTLEFLRNHPV